MTLISKRNYDLFSKTLILFLDQFILDTEEKRLSCEDALSALKHIKIFKELFQDDEEMLIN